MEYFLVIFPLNQGEFCIMSLKSLWTVTIQTDRLWRQRRLIRYCRMQCMIRIYSLSHLVFRNISGGKINFSDMVKSKDPQILKVDTVEERWNVRREVYMMSILGDPDATNNARCLSLVTRCSILR